MSEHEFYLDVKAIRLAHLFVLDRVRKCEYPQGRGQYGLVCVLSGRATYRFSSGERMTISDGDVLLLAPTAAYSIVTEGELRHYTANFEVHGEAACAELSEKPYLLLHGGSTEHIQKAFAGLVAAWTAKEAGSDMRAVGYLYELLSFFWLDVSNSRRPHPHHRLIAVREYIEEHFREPMSLAFLAGLAGMSVTSFRRAWQSISAEPPLRFRDSVRLFWAKEYLKSGFYTVSEVAERCGFDDVGYFIRFFRKKNGLPPLKFQKNAMEENC